MNIVVVGTVFVDIKGFPYGNFVPTGRNSGDVKQFHGGVGRNIAENIAGLGESVTFVGLVDKSGTGIDVVGHLKQKGINTDYVRATADGMGTWLAVFDENGDICANISKRPELLPICDILKENGTEIFQNADSVFLEIDIDEEIVAAVFALAEKYSLPVQVVISNMTIAKERAEYIKKAECFVCNRQEAGILFGQVVENLSVAEMLELVKRKRDELGIKRLVVTLDADGAVFAGSDDDAGSCPAKKVKVVDVTGAGDAFFSGTAVGLTRGMTLSDACSLGTDTAANVIVTKENVYSG